MKVIYKFQSTDDDKFDASTLEYLQKAAAYFKKELSDYENSPGVLVFWINNIPDFTLAYTLIDCESNEQVVRTVLQAFYELDH